MVLTHNMHGLRLVSTRASALAAILAATAVLASACGSSPSPSQRPSASGTPAPAGPVKVFAYVPGPITSTAQVDSEANRLRSTPAYGISWKFKWSTVEPQQGVYDWSLIDHVIQVTQAEGKKTMLRVIAGVDSPAWIEQQAHTVSFSNSTLFTPANYPPTVSMPVPWDPTYLSRWEQFIAAYGQRYNGNPQIWSVQMSGGGYIGEMTLPHDTTTWSQAGFSDQAITSAWDSIVDSFRRAFPDTPTNLDIDPPLPKGESNALPAILAYVLHTYPGKVYIQQNGLRAAYANSINNLRQDIRMAAPVTTVGYQMYGGSGSILSANTGDRMTAFQVALSDHASYLEVYDTDLLNSSLSSDIHYLISGGTSG